MAREEINKIEQNFPISGDLTEWVSQMLSESYFAKWWMEQNQSMNYLRVTYIGDGKNWIYLVNDKSINYNCGSQIWLRDI